MAPPRTRDTARTTSLVSWRARRRTKALEDGTSMNHPATVIAFVGGFLAFLFLLLFGMAWLEQSLERPVRRPRHNRHRLRRWAERLRTTHRPAANASRFPEPD